MPATPRQVMSVSSAHWRIHEYVGLNSFAILIALTLISVAVVPGDLVAVETPLHKNEVKNLLKTAKSPGDHRRRAAYYRQEAERLVVSSNEHGKQAAAYQKAQPFAALEVKHGSAFGQGVAHCLYFAKLAGQAAKTAEAQAARHEEMAKRAEAVSATFQSPTH